MSAFVSRGSTAGLLRALLMGGLGSIFILASACDSEPKPQDALRVERVERSKPVERPRDVDRPNLVLIIGDDHGYPYFGFMGDTSVRTPNLDRLASQGTVFTTGYVTSSRCMLSLISLLTGLEPYQWTERLEVLHAQGVVRPPNQSIRDFQTLPRLLQERGYVSFQAGKYWAGPYEAAGFSEGTRGADTSGGKFVQMMGGAEGLEVGRTTMKPVFDFIDRHRDEPFFMWYAPRLPHNPMDAPEHFHEPYRGRGFSESAVKYYANISRFDSSMGELIDYLEEKGLSENTLIVYLSDNGWDQGAHESYPTVGMFTGYGEKGKGSLHELGFRTPIIVKWPGRVPAGVVHEGLVSSIDIFHTLLDYADVSAPANRTGSSLRPVLEQSAEISRQVLIGQMPNATLPGTTGGPPSPSSKAGVTEAQQIAEGFFLRDADWHYLWFPEIGREELYSMKQDPDETHNVVGDHAELIGPFQARIRAWQEEMLRSVAGSLPRR